jgi:hypothetical protein
MSAYIPSLVPSPSWPQCVVQSSNISTRCLGFDCSDSIEKAVFVGGGSVPAASSAFYVAISRQRRDLTAADTHVFGISHGCGLSKIWTVDFAGVAAWLSVVGQCSWIELWWARLANGKSRAWRDGLCSVSSNARWGSCDYEKASRNYECLTSVSCIIYDNLHECIAPSIGFCFTVTDLKYACTTLRSQRRPTAVSNLLRA